MKAPTVDRRGSIAEGLEVVPFGDPQANHSLPSHENYPEVAGPGSEGLEVVEKEEAESLHPQRKPWWKRPIILGVIAGVIVAIALGIGLGVGLGVKSKKSDGGNPSSSSGSNNPNPCAKDFCTQSLSLTAASSRLYIARKTADDIVQYRTSDNGKAFDPWQNLTGKVSEPPLALYFEPDGRDPRFDLFSVSKKQGTLVNRFLQSGIWSDWKVISQDAGSGPAGCSPRSNRTDVWFKQGETKGVMHTRYDDDGTKYVGDVSLVKQTTATRPGVACRSVRTGVSHDMVVYDPNDSSAIHRQHAGGTWKDAKNMGGKFIGEPYVIATSATRIDFLGIGDDKQMYHFSSSQSGDYSKLESLGGEFASMPSAVVVGPDGARVDVLAVGTDGKLKHQTMTQSQWGDDWEDLGIAVQSAPNLVLFKDMIHLFADADGGQLMHAFWDPSSGALEWKSTVDLKSLD